MTEVNRNKGIALGIDVGGTFTDVLALDLETGAVTAAFKLPSTPANPKTGRKTSTMMIVANTIDVRISSVASRTTMAGGSRSDSGRA